MFVISMKALFKSFIFLIMMITSSFVLASNLPERANCPAIQGVRISSDIKMVVAASIKSAVQKYFAHWQGVPYLNFQDVFSTYLSEINSTTNRKEFDMATIKLLASLRNGHTGFYDDWLWKNCGQKTGLSVEKNNGKWVVINSTRKGVPPGSVIVSIDDEPISEFYENVKGYIPGSSDFARTSHLFNTGYLFPIRFTLGLSNGKDMIIDREVSGGVWRNPVYPKDLPDGTFYHAIHSFSNAKSRKQALKFVRKHMSAKVLILDVRDNGGGTTPSNLIRLLVKHRYVGWSEASAMSIGLFYLYGDFARSGVVTKNDSESYGYVSAFDEFFRSPMFYVPGKAIYPSDNYFSGHLIILVNGGCASACEDFVMPLKASKSALIIGQSTFGSSGQPYVKKFTNGMTLRVGAKRMYFGNGDPFEGVGIKPDIFIIPSAQDIYANRDPVLTKAIKVARMYVGRKH